MTLTKYESPVHIEYVVEDDDIQQLNKLALFLHDIESASDSCFSLVLLLVLYIHMNHILAMPTQVLKVPSEYCYNDSK